MLSPARVEPAGPCSPGLAPYHASHALRFPNTLRAIKAMLPEVGLQSRNLIGSTSAGAGRQGWWVMGLPTYQRLRGLPGNRQALQRDTGLAPAWAHSPQRCAMAAECHAQRCPCMRPLCPPRPWCPFAGCAAARGKAIRAFQTDPPTKVFLLTYR